jgi:exopolyphosphatase / guanosine-5'-triphosphate,3'-diphosphate pyrophosphatase
MKKVLNSGIVEYGLANGFDKNHACAVADLSLRLFDELQPMHRMGNTERLWLYTAAMMHDVAKYVDNETHHKLARDAIIECDFLPFRKKTRKMTALIARYHRGSLPEKNHKYYRDLDVESKLYVRKLAAILRIADGLCANSQRTLNSIKCRIKKSEVIAHIKCTRCIYLYKAIRKSQMFEDVFGKVFVFDLKVQPDKTRKPQLVK